MRKNIMQANRVVIKIGTSSITYVNGNINLKKMDQLVRVISDLQNSGKEIVVVSSGAVGAGMGRIGIIERPKELNMKQALAAIGQAILMELYQKFFGEYNRKIAQILLTRDVFCSKIKENNAFNTMSTLLSMGVIPIVNENDTVSTSEIEGDRIGDNDTLSAMVAGLVEADLLLILSDVEGLCDTNPCKNPNAKLISHIDKLSEEILSLAEDSKNEFGTGGMITKLNAAKIASKKNIPTILTCSDDIQNIYDALDGKEIGTFISAKANEV
ncbi:glutamate 5-kinase [Alkalibaculum sp. M08DMB]|uniref:Glutamate 5-kinase n=1 Tax=Alkalibaculum sporogenes TaxID=2655001 RepID=A0A6A7K5R3_9FIRM|nr:glutamate 5-kinase [Alkalibaculum sporogenes]MPW24681.1 glutamate 5-kinase [Alkalibaculum sporogenes]